MSNDISNSGSRIASLVDLLRWRSLQQGDQAVFSFQYEQCLESTITFSDLDRQARRIGAWLQALNLRGERALLLFPPGLEYIAAFFGCLYGAVVPVPAYPPRRNRSAERVRAIVKDSGATVAMTTQAAFAQAQWLFDELPELQALNWLLVEEAPANAECAWRDPEVAVKDLAFLQYTSGSTTDPRGVMLTHQNLLHNSHLIQERFGHSARSRGVIWLPPYHDMGLIGGIIQPLYAGFPCLLMSPVSFSTNPYSWLQAVSRFHGTTSGGPNFAYDLCVEKITPEQRATLDLSRWQVAFTGAEPIRQKTLERFAEVFAPCGFHAEAFYPCYGLAEATLFVSGALKKDLPRTITIRRAELERNEAATLAADGPDCSTLVSCGTGAADQRVITANPRTMRRCREDEVGEIWVSGPSVAAGYWNRPEETAPAFQASLADTGEGRFLRTGDLGFFRDGELFVTGRLKDLIIIRGRNLYPQDIEQAVESCHPSLGRNASAAFAVTHDHHDQLVVVAEFGRRPSPPLEEVLESIRRVIAEQFEVEVYAVALLKKGSIPRTSSAKIQRHQCRTAFLARGFEPLAEWRKPALPANPIVPPTRDELLAAPLEQRQNMLLAYLQAELALRSHHHPTQVDTKVPLTRLGLDSLTALELRNRLESAFGVIIPITEFLQGLTLAQLTSQVLAGLASSPEPRVLDGIVEHLDRLSDEEVKQLLGRYKALA